MIAVREGKDKGRRETNERRQRQETEIAMREGKEKRAHEKPMREGKDKSL